MSSLSHCNLELGFFKRWNKITFLFWAFIKQIHLDLIEQLHVLYLVRDGNASMKKKLFQNNRYV